MRSGPILVRLMLLKDPIKVDGQDGFILFGCVGMFPTCVIQTFPVASELKVKIY